MRSRITIDIDFDNQPCIRIDHQPSDDVKDKLVQRFLEAANKPGHRLFLNYESVVGGPETAVLRTWLEPVAVQPETLPVQEFEKTVATKVTKKTTQFKSFDKTEASHNYVDQ